MNNDQKSKVNSLLVLSLAVLFYFFFMHAKHDPTLSQVNAFGDDPYDAVGSFGIQAAAVLGIISVVRAFRGQRVRAAYVEHELFVLRAQMAAILSVGVTLAADAVAILRYPHVWIGSPSGYRLLALAGGMAILTIAIGTWVQRSASAVERHENRGVWVKALSVSSLSVLTLLFYPGSFRHGVLGVLFTAFAGTVILFASVWAWTTALIRDPAKESKLECARVSNPSLLRKYGWVVVALTGILVGLFFVAGEASEGSGIPRGRLAIVIAAYIGLETAGILFGYGLLRKPLGLFRGTSR